MRTKSVERIVCGFGLVKSGLKNQNGCQKRQFFCWVWLKNCKDELETSKKLAKQFFASLGCKLKKICTKKVKNQNKSFATSTKPKPSLLRLPEIFLQAEMTFFLTANGERFGSFCRSNVQAPATIGVATLVPLIVE